MSSILNSVDKIVINLADRQDRRERLEKELSRHNINDCVWFNAISKEDATNVVKCHSGNIGAIACAASHFTVACATPNPKVVIEDDICFSHLASYEKYFKSMDDLVALAPPDLDILQMDIIIGSKMHENRLAAKDLIIPWEYKTWSTALLYYSRSGVEKIKNWYNGDKFDVSFTNGLVNADILLYEQLNSYSLTLPMSEQYEQDVDNGDIDEGSEAREAAQKLRKLSRWCVSNLWEVHGEDLIARSKVASPD